MAMPRDMKTFEMPSVPEHVDDAALAGARDVLARFLALLERWDPERDPQGPRLEMAAIAAAVARASPTRCSAKARSRSRSRASGAFASRRASSPASGDAWTSMRGGVCCRTGSTPPRCRRSRSTPHAPRRPTACAKLELPAGAMNSPALLARDRSKRRRSGPGAPAHVDQPDAAAADPRGPRRARACAAGRSGGDHVARLRQLPHHVDVERATSGACSTSTHEHADPQHDRGRRDARVRDRVGAGPDRHPRRGSPSSSSGWASRAPSRHDPPPDRSAQTSVTCTWARSHSRDSATTARSGRRRGSSARSAGPCTTRPRATRCGRCRPARRSIDLPPHWTCPTCSATREQFLVIGDNDAEAALPDPSARLNASFRDAAERMQGLAIVNPALEVEAVGFAPWQDHWLGVMVTPWFMNLVLLPRVRSRWQSIPVGGKRTLQFPAGVYEFIGAPTPLSASTRRARCSRRCTSSRTTRRRDWWRSWRAPRCSTRRMPKCLSAPSPPRRRRQVPRIVSTASRRLSPGATFCVVA